MPPLIFKRRIFNSIFARVKSTLDADDGSKFYSDSLFPVFFTSYLAYGLHASRFPEPLWIRNPGKHPVADKLAMFLDLTMHRKDI